MELKDIPGIGDKTVASLNRSGINTVPELLTTYPRTYRTYYAKSVKEISVGDWVVLKGTINKPFSKHTFRATTQTATFWDLSGNITLRWFNMPYIVRSISPTSLYSVKGVVSEFAGRYQIISPQITKADEETQVRDQIVPVYSARGGMKPWVLRQKIGQTISAGITLPDPLKKEVIEKFDLLPYGDAIVGIHSPGSEEELSHAVRRLSFQELLELQLNSLIHRKSNKKTGFALQVKQDEVDNFLRQLPFEPTGSQFKAVDEILADMSQDTAMHRLLQGEVGSGKTVVAVASAIAAHSAGYRTIIMAPTQILAIQLYDNFQRYCEPLGITTSLITAKKKGVVSSDILVGTQALLNITGIENIGLVIVDEQHRFGVEQREKLARGLVMPHLLQMTATPIPRSMAQTVFHNLDITRLTDVPKNRVPVKTFMVPESKRPDSYAWIEREIIDNHNQVFIVVPLIEEAEENETAPLKSLKELEITLKRVFPRIEVDIMHGKMKESEKIEHMQKFKDGITQVLVATSMIEVGIDIPEANIIVIEDAERFGLAQLHQLRGRVGRGGKQGYCLLFSKSSSGKSAERLAYFIREKDGERLARFDLKKRGPGELFGTMQSGFFNLAMGSMYDEKLLKETYDAALMVIAS